MSAAIRRPGVCCARALSTQAPKGAPGTTPVMAGPCVGPCEVPSPSGTQEALGIHSDVGRWKYSALHDI